MTQDKCKACKEEAFDWCEYRGLIYCEDCLKKMDINLKETTCPNCDYVQTVVDDDIEDIFDCKNCNAIFRENGDYMW